MSAPSKKKPTVFILYIPGGAMLGLIPALTLSRLEALTETPTSELFQVLEGVSAGSILVAGFNVPGNNARKGAELFAQLGPRFFPNIPGRWSRMHIRIGINIVKFLCDLDPQKSDYLAIRNIERLCDKMKAKSTLVDPSLVDEFECEATQRWLTSKKQKYILDLGQQICEQDGNLEKYTYAVAELVATRTFTSRLGIVFKNAVVGVMDGVKNKWAKKEKCLFDASKTEETYKEMFGDRKISDSICSTYISTYDIVNNRVVTFSCLKDDLFSKDPHAPATIQNDIKLWDAVMASTANPVAFPPHITEKNLLCTDKAPVHKPRSVKDVLAAVSPGTRVVLVIAGTGNYLGKDLLEFMKRSDADDDSLTEAERNRKKLEILRDDYVEFGVTGNIVLGREILELESYVTSDAMDNFVEKLGKENIFNITPRLFPHTPQEKVEFPSRDVLDASPDNIKKIIKMGRKLSEEEDEQIRCLAQQLVDNLHLLGQMDNDKYARVCRRIGIKSFDTEAGIAKETEGTEECIVSNDNSHGLRRAWRKLKRRIFSNHVGEQHIPPAPGGPGEP